MKPVFTDNLVNLNNSYNAERKIKISRANKVQVVITYLDVNFLTRNYQHCLNRKVKVIQ